MTRPHTLLDPAISPCECGWGPAYETQAEADRRLAIHKEHAHGIKAKVEPRHLTGLSWQEASVDAIRATAATGEKFTFYDALNAAGLTETPNAKTAIGRLAQLCHDLGICHPCGYQNSTRKGTKSSAVRVWHQSASGCQECKKRGAR